MPQPLFQSNTAEAAGDPACNALSRPTGGVQLPWKKFESTGIYVSFQRAVRRSKHLGLLGNSGSFLMESTGAGKRLWHIMRVVLYMIRKGLSKDKLMMDLHLLRKLGKVIGKALGNLMTLHQHRGCRRHHHHHGVSLLNSGFSRRSLDPDVSFYGPREVEFSCSATPTYPSFVRNRHGNHYRYDDYEAMALAEALEMLNYEEDCVESSSVAPSPSPAGSLWSCHKSPVTVRRQVRVTDSPFPVMEEEVEKHIDEEAEQFIRRFYEQLRLQQRMNIPMTPEYKHRWNEAVMDRA